MTYDSHSVEETRRFGQRLGELLQPGDVVALIGDLGAGKTHLSQGICEGLEIDPADVGSPTFVLIQEHMGRLPVFHIDVYRLRDDDEFLELGVDELLGSDGVCLIEWADKVADLLPRDRLTVRLLATGETTRQLSLEATGRRSAARIEALRQVLSS